MSVGGEDVSSSLSSDDCIVFLLFSFGTYPVKSRISVAIGINSERQKTKIVRKYTTSFISTRGRLKQESSSIVKSAFYHITLFALL